MSYTYDQLAGLVATVHTKYPKNELTVTWDDNRFEAARIFNQDSIKKQGGTTITGKAMLSQTGTARYVGYYEVDELSQGEEIVEFTMPWCRMTANWSWDEFEILQNKSDPEGFIDLAKVKETQALWNLAKLFEDALWQAPTSATDNKYPRGIPYYIRMLDADADDGGAFSGQTIRYRNATTGTVCSGIDAATYTTWKNWADTYTAVDNDLIKKLRTAFLYQEFKAPLGATSFEVRKSAKSRIYTGRPNKAAMFDYLDAKDDVHTTKEAFGRMVVTEGTDMMINGVDVIGIQSLDAATDVVTGDATDPWYFVNLSVFQPVVYSGYWMNTMGPVHGGTKQHTVWTLFKDGAHNIWCNDPRSAGFVVHKPITA